MEAFLGRRRGGCWLRGLGLVEILRREGRRHVARADREVAEALTFTALGRVAADDRAEQRDDLGLGDVGLVEDVEITNWILL